MYRYPLIFVLFGFILLFGTAPSLFAQQIPPAPGQSAAPSPKPSTTPVSEEIPKGYPSHLGVDEGKLIELAQWIASDRNLKIFSLLISKNGTLIFELYTPGIYRNDSHYLMSVTKSVLATLIGIAIDQRKIPSDHWKEL